MTVNTVWPQASDFQKLAKMAIFGIFNKLLSAKNDDVARFARNVEWDFFCDFQTPWSTIKSSKSYKVRNYNSCQSGY